MCIKVNTDGHGVVNTRTTMVIEVKVSRIWRRRTGLRPSSLLEWTLVSGLSVNCCSHWQGFVVSGFFVQKGKLEMDRWVGAASGGLPGPFMLRSCGLLSWLLCAEIMFFFLCTVDTAKHQQTIKQSTFEEKSKFGSVGMNQMFPLRTWSPLFSSVCSTVKSAQCCLFNIKQE